MRTPEPLAYSPRQAAQIIGIGLTALYAEITAGRIKMKKYGRRTLIAADDLRAWFAALPDGEPS
jgi:excisionase family DNA binding protein